MTFKIKRKIRTLKKMKTFADVVPKGFEMEFNSKPKKRKKR